MSAGAAGPPNGWLFFLDVVLAACVGRIISYPLYRLRIPRIVGDIIAGCLLGPTVLQNLQLIIFPPENRALINLFGYFGLILASVTSGAAFDRQVLRGLEKNITIFAFLNIGMTFASCYILLLFFPGGPKFHGPKYNSISYNVQGRPGQFPPPAPRLAAAYRILRAEAVAAGLEGYDVSFEATHHGPWLTTPAMFLEVGSCEDQWGDPAAAAVWAKTLTRLLGLGGVAAESRPWPALGPKERARATAVVAVGGGHYHPAMGDIAAATGEHVYLGHLLASYSLGRVDGRWREVLSSAVDATRAAFPGVGRVVAFVAKNGLAAPHRDEVFRWLADHNVTAITNKKDI